MELKISNSWQNALKDELSQPYFRQLISFVDKEYEAIQVFPPADQVFHAFERTPLQKVKIVILGQDPYHGSGQANGLSFSVNDGVRQPPSLKNIFKEIKSDQGVSVPDSGNLERWADQGVLLLNTTLTVREGKPGSHQRKGWEQFTDAVIQLISKEREHVVFMLWGSHAHKKSALIDSKRHLILSAAHPSPLSAYRGFFGCRHFSQANAYLQAHGIEGVLW